MKPGTWQGITMAGFFTITFFSTHAQGNQTGLPGDHFNLHGALEAFKQSPTPETFEKLLNKANNNINNLDLNEDGAVDYVRVINKKEKNVQLFILQVPVTENENQDIAVIELERTGDDEAVIQIAGDEDIFGEEVIIEPASDDDRISFADGFEDINHGPAVQKNAPGLFINVWGWPGVRFVFAPGYSPWASPWRWHRPPYWYAPRKPLGWSVWYPQKNYYHRYYNPYLRHRIEYAPRMYRPVRSHSATVYHRHHPSVYKQKPVRFRSPVYHPRGYKQHPHGKPGKNGRR